MAKNKISRKQLLKEPDEFITMSGKIIQFGMRHRSKIIISAGVVVGVLLIFSLIHFFGLKANTKGFALLNQAKEKYESKLAQSDPETALTAVEKDFELILAEYSGYSSGKIARVEFANICYKGGQAHRAMELYDKALVDFGDDPAYRNFILYGLGYVYESLGNHESAARYFEMIASGDSALLKDQALFNLARVYDTLGKEDKRQEAFKKIVSDFPESIYIRMVKDQVKG